MTDDDTRRLVVAANVLLASAGDGRREAVAAFSAFADALNASWLRLSRASHESGNPNTFVEVGARGVGKGQEYRIAIPTAGSASYHLSYRVKVEPNPGIPPVLYELLNLLVHEVDKRRTAARLQDLRSLGIAEFDSLWAACDEVASALRRATDAAYVAVRLDHGEYRINKCLGFAEGGSGNSATVTKDDLELSASSILVRVYTMMFAGPPQVRVFRGPRDRVVDEVRRLTSDASVSSVAAFPFVLPAGKGIITLSFTATSYPEARDEPDVSEAVSAAAALISTRIAFHQAMTAREKLIKDFQIHTNQELIQGYRHAAGNSYEVLKMQLVQLFEGLRRRNIEGIEEHRTKIGLTASELTRALDGMKHLKVFDEVRLKPCEIEMAFEQAKDSLKDKLDGAQIDCFVSKEGLSKVRGDLNLLRVAFVNMMLNSIQSIAGSRRTGREIRLVISGHQPDFVSGTFSDTGAGFQPKGNVRSLADIWEVGKTTKDSGTGYGLPLVRFVFQDIHRGSIDVQDHRGGMTFRFRLPRDPKPA